MPWFTWTWEFIHPPVHQVALTMAKACMRPARPSGHLPGSDRGKTAPDPRPWGRGPNVLTSCQVAVLQVRHVQPDICNPTPPVPTRQESTVHADAARRLCRAWPRPNRLGRGTVGERVGGGCSLHRQAWRGVWHESVENRKISLPRTARTSSPSMTAQVPVLSWTGAGQQQGDDNGRARGP